MVWRALADLVLLLHVGFVIFVVLGGFLAIRWRWLPWLHLPAALWGSALEFGGWICPLTPLENWLRQASGAAGYTGGFIEHYGLSLLYPEGLTSQIQLCLGLSVILINGIAYACVFWHRTSKN